MDNMGDFDRKKEQDRERQTERVEKLKEKMKAKKAKTQDVADEIMNIAMQIEAE